MEERSREGALKYSGFWHFNLEVCKMSLEVHVHCGIIEKCNVTERTVKLTKQDDLKP